MVFHSDIFATQRKLVAPLSDMLNLIQCLLTGMVVLMHEEQVAQSVYRTSRGLPPAEWVKINQQALIDVFERSQFNQLWRACNDQTIAYKLDIEPRR
jgi:hypothetical protein